MYKPMTTDEVYAALRLHAPSVVFEVSKDYDDDEEWLEEYGEQGELEPYVVEFSAIAIEGGRRVEGSSYLSGCWMEPDEQIDDCDGYLLQKLEDAAKDLLEQVRSKQIKDELNAVIQFLKLESADRYEEEQRKRTEPTTTGAT